MPHLNAWGRLFAGLGLVLGLALAWGSPAAALPSYAQQTGAPCASCHVGDFGPQLTPFGRRFKLSGYGSTSSWNVNKGFVPLAGMAVATATHSSADQSGPAGPGFSANDNVALQELSGFIAGNVAPGLGVFAQATYSGIDKTAAMDNIDVRYAREIKLGSKNAILGVSLNNNPTVQDVWNSTPAWSFPYVSSDLAPGRSTAPLMAGGLSQQVLGVSPYIWLDDHWYAELGGYRSISASTLDKLHADAGGAIKGIAPYWRLAYSNTIGAGTLQVGAFNLDANILPDRKTGPSDQYRDTGLDASFQYTPSRRITYTLQGSIIDERRKLTNSFIAGDAAQAKGHVRGLSLDGAVYWNRKYGVTGGLFSTTGNADSVLYAPGADTGSRTGKPNTSGYSLQADWTPWGEADSMGAPFANLRLGAQYTGYTKFNGASSNYDGFGRKASDNNTISLFLWTAF